MTIYTQYTIYMHNYSDTKIPTYYTRSKCATIIN